MTGTERPMVTVVIPARNEAADIGECLRRVAAQDYPAGRLEVLVVDGASSDGTAAAAEATLAAHPFHRADVLVNPVGTTPSSLNLGLAAASGRFLCRVDARSLLPPHYVGRCVSVLEGSPDVAVVGGSQVATAAPGSGPVGRGIARALRNPLTTGLARYRRGGPSGPTDTVYLGAFRTSDLRAVGGWDERLLTNQDYELNRRLQRTGLVWFEAGIDVVYRPRTTLASLGAQYLRFGRWKAFGWREVGVPRSGRQVALVLAPPLGLLVAVVGLRRRPKLTVMTGVAAALLVDRAGDEEPSPAVRASSLAAAVVIGAAWWVGVVDQLVRASLPGRSGTPPGVPGGPAAGATGRRP